MKDLGEEDSDRAGNRLKKKIVFDNPPREIQGSVSSEAEPSILHREHQKFSVLWSGIWSPALSIFGSLSSDNLRIDSKSSCVSRKSNSGKSYYDVWRAAVRRATMNGISMRRILGFSKPGNSPSRSDIWLLGDCYRVALEGDGANSSDPTQSEGFAAFVENFSSRILMTYRKGFVLIGDTKYSSDVNWGCMLRSSQMLVAQAFLLHKLGRSWRKSSHKPLDSSYIEILHMFGDSDDSPCSIHNLLRYGKAFGLAPGSWVGPYAMCRTWESLMSDKRRDTDDFFSSVMDLYVVSGSDGERGGAPVLCIEDVYRHVSEFCRGQVEWVSILFMVPLVLGVEKVNPRYLPLLNATFTFPQSLGILGGKPGVSTYIVGVQDEKAFYLDPHDVQQAVDIKKENVDVDTSSYHCNIVRHMSLDSIDSSLALGFYCKDKSDFDDFCFRASELINQSNGAPLFTIAKSRSTSTGNTFMAQDSNSIIDTPNTPDDCPHEDDWQLL